MKLGLGLSLNSINVSGVIPGVLDDYPGASMAYSLRYLTNDYTGDVIVVERSGDNATAKALSAGDEVFGFSTTLSVSSGELRAYRA